MRLELTRVGLLVVLANHYTTTGAYIEQLGGFVSFFQKVDWQLYKTASGIWLISTDTGGKFLTDDNKEKIHKNDDKAILPIF